MKKIIAGLICAAALWLAGDASAQTFDFSNLQYVIGTGTNEAALVIDWNDGITPEALAWGYCWNGSCTGLQMLNAVAAADSRVHLFTIYGGTAVYGIGFDLTGSGGTFAPGTPGLTTETGTAPYAGDHYAEGWRTGFWGYDIGTGDPYTSGSWTKSAAGAGSRQLANGSWDGWSFSTNNVYPFDVPDPGFPTAVQPLPEPSSIGLILIGMGGFLHFARKHRRGG